MSHMWWQNHDFACLHSYPIPLTLLCDVTWGIQPGCKSIFPGMWLKNINLRAFIYDLLDYNLGQGRGLSQINCIGTSLVVQWWRLCLPMQGVWVWSPVRKFWSHIPLGQRNKIQNRSHIVTNWIKTLKMTHIKKNLKKMISCIFLKNIPRQFWHRQPSNIGEA